MVKDTQQSNSVQVRKKITEVRGQRYEVGNQIIFFNY